MTSYDPSIHVSQRKLWDIQHAERGATGGLEGAALVDTPNELALILGGSLTKGSAIVEIGAANGRDARYWARREGHSVLALDFSQVALEQLTTLAKQQGVEDKITTGLFDASTDPLPASADTYDAFYARSALHVTSPRLSYLMYAVHGALHEGGIVAIEGKHPDDPKIKRSIAPNPADQFLVSDPFENGHIRRAWDPEHTLGLLSLTGFTVNELEVVSDTTVPGEPAVFTRIMATKE
jgi:cyclopropane fatty-acyl-phospholipid synthase-like methyltransferase